MIVFGRRLFGKVQKTGSGYFVATMFYHISFFPLFPSQSFIVARYEGGSVYGERIGLNKLSIFVAYLRAVCIASPVLFLIIALGQFEEMGSFSNFQTSDLFIFLGGLIWSIFCAVGIATSYMHPKIAKATPTNEEWIHRELGLTPAPNPHMSSDQTASGLAGYPER